MFKITDDGRIVSAEDGVEVESSVLQKITKKYNFLTEDEHKEQVNYVVSKRVAEKTKQLEAVQKKRVSELEDQLNNFRGSLEEKEELENKLEEALSLVESADERASRKKHQEIEERDKRIKSLSEESKYWQKHFQEEYATHRILSAAQKKQPFDVNNFVDHLKLREKWVDERDEDGRATGKKVPRYSVSKYDEEVGQEIEVECDIDKAVEIVAEKNPHWLKGNQQSGPGINYHNKNKNSFTEEQIRSMSLSEFEKLQKDGVI